MAMAIPEAKLPEPRVGRALLIVEDDPALRSYLASSLGDRGYEVSTAGDRAEAASVITGTTVPDLVLLDLGLPPAPSAMS